MSATATFTPFAAVPAQTYMQDGDPLLFKHARTWWLLLALFLLAQGNGIFTVASGAGEKLKTLKQFYSPSTTTLVMLTVVLWVVGAGLMVKRIGPIRGLMLEQKAVLSFAILAFLSTLWSPDPSLTLRKATLLFLTFAFAWFFAASYPSADQMRVLLAAGFILALSSTAMAILLPKYGLDSGGEWKGVFAQKNELGFAMFFLFSGLVFRPSGYGLRRIALLAILPFGLIVMSQSKESLVLAILLVVVRLYAPFVKNSRKDQLPFILFATIFAVLGVVFGREIILSLLGRDSTLTGRTQEWAILFPYALKHFWLGYGYQGFWTGTGDSLRAITKLRAAIRGADSGYLDTMLQFGIAGIILWLVVMLATVKDFLRLFRMPAVSRIVYWYASLILATFVGSFVGTIFLFPTTLGSFAFVFACAGLRNLNRENALVL